MKNVQTVDQLSVQNVKVVHAHIRNVCVTSHARNQGGKYLKPINPARARVRDRILDAYKVDIVEYLKKKLIASSNDFEDIEEDVSIIIDNLASEILVINNE